MPRVSQISSLTTKVYGPYYDHFLFKNTYPKDGVTLEVKDLQMYCNNREIGYVPFVLYLIAERLHGCFTRFDATEFIGSPPEGSIRAKNEKVVIFAVYKIPSLDCLSEQALEYLQRDLREYDEEIRVGRSGLTLQTLYGDKTWVGSRIRVRVACNMTLSAHFLTCESLVSLKREKLKWRMQPKLILRNSFCTRCLKESECCFIHERFSDANCTAQATSFLGSVTACFNLQPQPELL